MKYQKVFASQSEYETFASSSSYVEPHVSVVQNGTTVLHYNKSKKYRGGSVLDLTDIDNNPNLEMLPQASWPNWVNNYATADIADKYLCHKLKDFVLSGLTGETPTIQTVITDWRSWSGTEIVTRESDYIQTTDYYWYDWGWGSFLLNYQGVPGAIWYYVTD